MTQQRPARAGRCASYSLPRDGGLPLLRDRGRRRAGADRRLRRAHGRLHGHQPGDQGARARRAARPQRRPDGDLEEDLAATMSAAQRLAKRIRETLEPDGFNILNSCGSAAWQTVFHFHVHVIPRYEGDRPAEAALDPPRRRCRRDRGDRGDDPPVSDLVRLERDGPLAVVILDSPPLNLFGQDLFKALVERIDEVAASDARALLYRAEGDLFTGGADVNDFQKVVEEGGGSDRGGSLLIAAHKMEALEIPTLASSTGSA